MCCFIDSRLFYRDSPRWVLSRPISHLLFRLSCLPATFPVLESVDCSDLLVGLKHFQLGRPGALIATTSIPSQALHMGSSLRVERFPET